MAIIIHPFSATGSLTFLWMSYLKSGTGKPKSNQMNNDDVGPPVSPVEGAPMIQECNREIRNACLTLRLT